MTSEFLFEQAALARGKDDPWTSVQFLRGVLRSPIASSEVLQQGIVLAREIGDEWGAIELAKRLRTSTGEAPVASYVLAEALTDAGRASEAVTLLAPQIDLLDDNLVFKFSRMLMLAGRKEEAHARARALLKNNQNSPTLWERLAQTKTFSAGDPDIPAMRRVFSQWPLSKPVSRCAIAAALAKAMVDVGDDAEANRFLMARGEAFQALYPYDPRVLEFATRDIEAWCAAGIADNAKADISGGDRPIFILGPNRSGTTLVDQILSMHPEVVAGGERRHFWIATRALGDCSPKAIDAHIALAGDKAWSVIGARYLALADEAAGRQARFTDKLLSNLYRVRAIHQSLPGARVIYVRRNPLAVAWSCWRGQFDRDAPWSGSPEGVAQYVLCYRRSMEAWRRRFPDMIHAVDYEDLVQNPERVIPRLLEFCGLEDNPATRSPHLSKRSSPTLSFDAVREPIHARSVDAAADFPISTRALSEALARDG